MKPIERAIAIAVEAHAGQIDKAGAPYVFHPLRLMLRMDSEVEMMAAVLHDVVEDGPGWTFERLAGEGIPPDVIEAVDCLTKRPEEKKDYDAFIRRAARNPIARRVKLADLEDNMDLRRIASPTDRDFTRIEKYRSAHALLKSMRVAKRRDHALLNIREESQVSNNSRDGTWAVLVMDLFHTSESEGHYLERGFATREDACDYARDFTWASVQELRQPGMTAEALKSQWWTFGESASVEGEPPYSGADEIDYFVAYEYRLGQPDWIVDSAGVAKAAPPPGVEEWHRNNYSEQIRESETQDRVSE